MAINQSANAVQRILLSPVTLGANKLCILTNQASPNMASWILKTYDERRISGISLELIITSVPEQGISKMNHEGFIALQKAFRKGKPNIFTCSYLYGVPALKENLYVWLCNEEPMKAFSCSYDFTQSSLLRGSSGSVSEKIASSAYKTFEKAVENSIYCVSSEVDDYVVIGPSKLPTEFVPSTDDPNYVTLSLVVKKTGEPGKRSGLNWGQRKKRNPNEAYIPLPRKIAQSVFSLLENNIFLSLQTIIIHCNFVLSSKMTKRLRLRQAMHSLESILETVSAWLMELMFIQQIWMLTEEEMFRFIKLMMNSTIWIFQ